MKEDGWVSVNKTWGDWKREARAGVLIEVETPAEPDTVVATDRRGVAYGSKIIPGKPAKRCRLLIGDINPLGGVCDDCTGISRDDVVIAYKKLDIGNGWEPQG